VNLGLDLAGVTTIVRQGADIGGGRRLVLAFNVDTAFACDTFNATLEFQLVSMPIVATKLSDGSGGATDGKRTHIAGVTATIATDLFSGGTGGGTLVANGLSLGTPVYLSDINSTLAGVVVNTIYYVVPEDANSFKLALSLANALAGTTIDLTSTNDVVTIEFIPTIHASSGGLQLFDVGAPTNQGPLVIAATRFMVPLRPLVGMNTKLLGPTSQAAAPIAGELTQPVGAGPEAGRIAANAQRFYYLRYIPSATITAGAITCDLVLEPEDSLKYYASGVETIG
jgi:hypothetical protein